MEKRYPGLSPPVSAPAQVHKSKDYGSCKVQTGDCSSEQRKEIRGRRGCAGPRGPECLKGSGPWMSPRPSSRNDQSVSLRRRETGCMLGTPVWWEIWSRQVPHSEMQQVAPLFLTVLNSSLPTAEATAYFSFLKP